MFLLKSYSAICFLLLLVSACEQETIRYSSSDNVYFDYSLQGHDTLQIHTFAYTPDVVSDTAYFPVKLSGTREPFDRQFRINVDRRFTTAVAGIHYKPFEGLYTLDADSGRSLVPVIIYNRDRTLAETPVVLSLTLAPTDELGTIFNASTTSSISISNRLEKPTWWDLWSNGLSEYSRVKHGLFLIAVGNVNMPSEITWETQPMIPFCLFTIDRYRQFLNDPFTWLEINDRGYVLSKRPGEDAFDFYNERNPVAVYTLRLNEEDHRYFFIDENGKNVTLN